MNWSSATGCYDVYGNITQLITDGSTQSTPTDASTNRLQGPLASYDAGGNVTSLHFGSESYKYTYDGSNMMKYLQSNTDLSRVYLYNADDERIATFECPSGVCDTREALETWTLRGFDNQVLRIYEHPWNEGWQWKEDHVFGSQKLLAAEMPSGVRHQHTDHLGTPRQITGASDAQTALHGYHAFGEEATSPSQDELALKFTGHERDALPGSERSLDYMHARFHSPDLGRFMSVDPADESGKIELPVSWNKYAYGLNNPVKYLDPDGESPVIAIAVALAVGGLFASSAANAPETFDTPQIGSRSDPALDVMAAEATLGGVGNKIFGLFSGLIGKGLSDASARFIARGSGEILDTSRVLIPGPRNSPFGKLDFLMGRVPGSAKSVGRAGTFSKTLGFTDDGLEAALRSHLADNFGNASIEGSKITVTATLKGPKGATRSVRSVWQVLEDGSVELITAFEKKK